MVEREVRADDPNLSPEANRLLTEELQDAVGTDRVRLPRDQADDAGRVKGSGEGKLGALLASNRLFLAVTFVALVIVGVIVSLATHTWWAVVAACGVHALGTLLVGSLTLRLSTEVEHVDPSTAARLEDEGVGDPDRALSDLVEAYAAAESPATGDGTVSDDHNRVTAEPADAPLRSAAEQKRAMTPAGTPVGPSGGSPVSSDGDHGSPVLLPLLAVGASVIVGVVAAIALGGIAWLAALMLVGAAIGWFLLTRYPKLPLMVPIVVLAVVGGVILVGAIADYL
jgi:Flp pilus assembly protein TadB